MKSLRREKLLGLALALLILALVLAVSFIEPPSAGVAGSVSSTAADGRRKLFLLLDELGFAPQVWNKLPGKLPRAEDVLWIERAPEHWTQEKTGKRRDRERDAAAHDPDADEDTGTEHDQAAGQALDSSPDGTARRARDTSPAALELHALAHYRRFVEEGGVIVLDDRPSNRAFLIEVLGFDDFEHVEAGAKKRGTELERHVRTESGEELAALWPADGMLVVRDDGDARVRTLWSAARDGEGSDDVLAISVREGGGEIVLLGDSAFLDNDSIEAQDHGLLAVRLAESVARGGRLWFDEYALGLWEPQTLTGLALSPALFLSSLHLVLLLVLFVWQRAWTREFPRDPEPWAQVSALSRARARAQLLERAGRHARLAELLRQGVLHRLRLSAGATRSPERTLAAIARRAGGREPLARWREVLTRPVTSGSELEALGGDLERLENELAQASGRSLFPLPQLSGGGGR